MNAPLPVLAVRSRAANDVSRAGRIEFARPRKAFRPSNVPGNLSGRDSHDYT